MVVPPQVTLAGARPPSVALDASGLGRFLFGGEEDMLNGREKLAAKLDASPLEFARRKRRLVSGDVDRLCVVE